MRWLSIWFARQIPSFESRFLTSEFESSCVTSLRLQNEQHCLEGSPEGIPKTFLRKICSFYEWSDVTQLDSYLEGRILVSHEVTLHLIYTTSHLIRVETSHLDIRVELRYVTPFVEWTQELQDESPEEITENSWSHPWRILPENFRETSSMNSYSNFRKDFLEGLPLGNFWRSPEHITDGIWARDCLQNLLQELLAASSETVVRETWRNPWRIL